MFFVTLKFSANMAAAMTLMAEHNAWIQRGVDEGVFHAVGSLADGTGGAIVAAGCSESELNARLAEDPFIAEDVVTPEVTAFTPNLTSDALAFLLN